MGRVVERSDCDYCGANDWYQHPYERARCRSCGTYFGSNVDLLQQRLKDARAARDKANERAYQAETALEEALKQVPPKTKCCDAAISMEIVDRHTCLPYFRGVRCAKCDQFVTFDGRPMGFEYR